MFQKLELIMKRVKVDENMSKVTKLRPMTILFVLYIIFISKTRKGQFTTSMSVKTIIHAKHIKIYQI